MIIIGLIGTLLYYIILFTFIIFFTPIAFIVWVVTTPFDKKRYVNHHLDCVLGKIIIFLNPFWRAKIHGLDKVNNKETFIIAPNHQSLTDICIIASTHLDFKWVSKKELTYVPFLGWIMAMAKYVLVDRKDPRSQFSMMRSCEENLNNGVSIAIFPEGTRSKTGELGKIRDGASMLAKKTGKKIFPVCVHGNHKAMPKKGFIWTKIVPMNVYFLDPIEPGEFKTKELSNMIRDAIQTKLDELNS